MIQSKAKPKYRIHYRECTQDKNHEGEKMNFVCLNQKCYQNSLICSMCREDGHKGHSTQPLKFYIQNLKQQYQTEKKDYQKQMESLKQSRAIFLIKLRQSVEKVAEEFRKLELEVIQKFQQLQNQLIQNQSKKNKFDEFYQSLTTQSEENPQFLIRNYLPTKQSQNLDNIQPIQQLGKKLSNLIVQTRHSVFTDLRIQEKIIQNPKFQQKLASSVIKTGNIYSQTNPNFGAMTLSAIAVDLVKNFQKTKIKIRITKIKKGGFIYIGAIQKQLFKSLNNKSPATWNGANIIGKIFYYNNTSATFGHTNSQLKTFSQNSNIQVSMNGNIMKIAMKKHSAQFNIPINGEFYFFFNLQGQTQIQLLQIAK